MKTKITNNTILFLFLILSIFLVSIQFTTGALTDNMLGYWDFQNNSIVDSTGYKNGTMIGGNKVTNGIIGYAINITNTSTYINFSNDIRYSQLQNNKPFTYNLWIKPHYVNAQDRAMLTLTQGGGTTSSFVHAYRTQVNNYYETYNGTNWGVSSYDGTVLTKGVWTMITVTYDGTNMNYTKNISVIESKPYKYIGNSLNILGINTWNLANPDYQFVAEYDELGIWNRSLSYPEILLLYNNGSGLPYANMLTNTTPQTYNITNTQSSTNISSNMLNFTINSSITSNFNFSNSTQSILYYGIMTTLNNNCSTFYQSTCVRNGTYTATNMTRINSSYFTKTLFDNDIFSGYYPYNYTIIDNTAHLNETVSNGNNILFNVTNFSTSLNYSLNLEFNTVNKTGVISSLLIYYCNSSYILNDGNPSLRDSCQLIDSYSALTVEHLHNNSRHRVIPVTNITIPKTQNSFFIFVGLSNVANGWNFGYITHTNYNNASFRFGDFNLFNNPSSATNKIFDIHLHPYAPNDYLQYLTIFTDNITSTNTSVSNVFYNISYLPPNAVIFSNPNCDNTSTTSYTYGSTNNYTFLWGTSYSQLGYPINYAIYYSDLLDITRTLLFNTTGNSNTSYIANSSTMNSITIGDNYLYIKSYDSLGSDTSKSDCVFTICQNNYVRTIESCVANAKLINYTDTNSCSERLNEPSDTGTYEYCIETVNTQTIYSDDMLMLIILFLLIIISTVCAVIVHEMFFGLNALLSALVWVVFLTYDYPTILLYAMPFVIIVFTGAWVLVNRAKR